jgi:hypothetical protein
MSLFARRVQPLVRLGGVAFPTFEERFRQPLREIVVPPGLVDLGGAATIQRCLGGLHHADADRGLWGLLWR